MQQQVQQTQHWKDRAIERSEAISDAWEVGKVYAGRFAEWILFFCMAFSVVQSLPGIHVWEWITNTVLAVQIFTLDIAGFGLSTLAEQAREAGNDKAASKAEKTGYALIGIMIITLLLIVVGTLVPVAKPACTIGENILILVRIVLTVLYGHVMHSLRRVTQNKQVQPAPPAPRQVQPESLTLDQVQKVVQEQVQAILTKVQAMVQEVHASTTDQVQGALAEVQALHYSIEEVAPVEVQKITLAPVTFSKPLPCPPIARLHLQVLHQVQAETSAHLHLAAPEEDESVAPSAPVEVQKIAEVQPEVQVQTGASVEVQAGVLEVQAETDQVQEVQTEKVQAVSLEVQGATDLAPQPAGYKEAIFKYVKEQLAAGNIPTVKDVGFAVGCKRRTAVQYRKEAIDTFTLTQA